MRQIFESPFGFILVISLFLLMEYYGYIAIRTSFRRWSKTRRNFILVVYIFCSVAFWLLLSNVGTLIHSRPESFLGKYLVTFLMGFFLLKAFNTVFLLLGDVYRFFVWLVRKMDTRKPDPNETPKPAGISRSRFLSQMSLLAGGLIFGTMLYGTTNKYNYRVRKQRLWFPHFPQAFSGLKIVHISDIHCGSFDSAEGVAKGVKMIMEQNPDMILFTGDLVNEKSSELLPYKEIFSQLRAPLGVFAVLGNHDYGDYHRWDSEADKVANIEALKQYISEMGWELLINEHIVFEKKNERIALLGVENWSAKPQFPKYGKLDEAVAGLAEKNPQFQILMSHDPSHWDAEIRPQYPNIDMTLSGHTHGMQFGVRLPWLNWSPVKMQYKQWMGLYQEGNQVLYVNAGYGFVGYKGRVGILPEITVLELMHG